MGRERQIIAGEQKGSEGMEKRLKGDDENVSHEKTDKVKQTAKVTRPP